MSHHSFSANSYAYSSLQSSSGGGGSSYSSDGGCGSPLNIEVRFPKLTEYWGYLGAAITVAAFTAPLIGFFVGGVCDIVMSTPLTNLPFGLGEAKHILGRTGNFTLMGLLVGGVGFPAYGLTSIVATSAVAIYNQIEKEIIKYIDDKAENATYRANLQSAKFPKDFEMWKNNHAFITKAKPNHKDDRSADSTLTVKNSILDKIKKYREEVIDVDTTMFTNDKEMIKDKDTIKFKNKLI